MAGIYIHIPFCKKACHYCNFHFSTSTAFKTDFIEALLKEIALTAIADPAGFRKGNDILASESMIETIYFGGGTPSLLTADELQIILHKLNTHFGINPGAEITLEANPDDISVLKLQQWKAAGINRLSIGVQSFFEEDLVWMNRAHNSAQAMFAIEAALQEGFHNMTVDLIYGTPALTDARWKHNVEQVFRLGVPHVSCYALTVEPSTALDKMIRQKKSPDIDPDKQATQFLLLTTWMEKAGYEQYEISNFAKPGMRSRHNSGYWQGKKYLGLGPSAHSYNGSARSWNIANNALYIRSLRNNILPAETEHLTAVQHLNEYIMTSLRTAEGIDVQYMADHFGKAATAQLDKGIRKYLESGKVESGAGAFRLTREGRLFADGIAADLFQNA